LGATVATASTTLLSGVSGLVSARAVPVVFPALSVAYLKPHSGYPGRVRAYLNGVAVGKKNTLALMTKAASSCPGQKFVLIGYSQGAMVMHQVLTALAATPQLLDRVALAVLIADPDRAGGQGVLEGGTASDGVTGVDTWLRRQALQSAIPIPASVRSRTASLCNSGDLVCDFNAKHLARFSTSAAVHTRSYASSTLLKLWGTRAAAYAVRMFPHKSCASVMVGNYQSVCFYAAAGNRTGLVSMLAPDASDPATVALMQASWRNPESQLQMVRAMHADYGGTDWLDYPAFAGNPYGVQGSWERSWLATGARWLHFSVPRTYRDGYVPAYRGLVVSFVYDPYATTPGTEYKFEGVFHYGRRDSVGLLCRWPDVQYCT
jgi:hypothetical protein